MKKRKNKRFVAAWTVFLLGTVLLLMVVLYASGAYHENATAKRTEAALLENGDMTWHNGYAVLMPEKAKRNGTGILFYPGGLVDARAYVPLLNRFREEGYTCVLMTMPFDLAVFDLNAADYIYPNLSGLNVNRWYLSGHSLGGVAAEEAYRGHKDRYAGVLLLGSYVTDPKQKPEESLTIYGTADHVLNRSKVHKINTTIVRLKGGNHGQFGNYGHQKGDGKSSISAAEQQEETVRAVNDFIEKTGGSAWATQS